MFRSFIVDELLGADRAVRVTACRSDLVVFPTTAGFLTTDAGARLGGAALTTAQLTLLVTEPAVLLFCDRRLAGWAGAERAPDTLDAWARLHDGGLADLAALLTDPRRTPCPVPTGER